MTSIPSSMKSWVVTRSGKPREALQFKTNWPTPAPPKSGEVLIRVTYAALNPLDIVMMGWPTFFKKNAVPAVDFAGEILQLGPSVSSVVPDLRVGMTVCGRVPTMRILRGYGTMCEYIVLSGDKITEKPPGIDDGAAAAAMGIAGQTTTILMGKAGIAKGDRVLVKGASGGVGCFVLQVLRAKGAHVTAICSGKNEELVRRLGADEVIDYTAHASLYNYLSTTFGDAKFDTILDLVGDTTLYWKSPNYLKPNGKFMSIASGTTIKLTSKLPRFLGGIPRTYYGVDNLSPDNEAKRMADGIKSGLIKEIPIDSTYVVEDALQAFERQASKRAQGKIVVKVSCKGVMAAAFSPL